MRDPRSLESTLPAAALLLLAAGCSSLGESSFDPEELDRTPGWVAVRDVPPVLQKEKTDCGAASLSMVFAHWGILMASSEVSKCCHAIPEQGIQAKELRDVAWEQGLHAYLIHGCWEDFQGEIGRGHPLIVGLVKPDRNGAATHYEVVVALHPEEKTIVTLDPALGWRQHSWAGFRKEWEPAGYLTLVFFRGDMPAPSKTGP